MPGDVWHCPEHGCELEHDSGGGSFCPAGGHAVSDAVLAFDLALADTAAELGTLIEAWVFMRSLAS